MSTEWVHVHWMFIANQRAGVAWCDDSVHIPLQGPKYYLPKKSVLMFLIVLECSVRGELFQKRASYCCWRSESCVFMGKQFQKKRVLELLTFVKFRKLRVDREEPSSKKERPKVPNVPDAPRVACWWGGAVPKKSVLNNPIVLDAPRVTGWRGGAELQKNSVPKFLTNVPYVPRVACWGETVQKIEHPKDALMFRVPLSFFRNIRNIRNNRRQRNSRRNIRYEQ